MIIFCHKEKYIKNDDNDTNLKIKQQNNPNSFLDILITKFHSDPLKGAVLHKER